MWAFLRLLLGCPLLLALGVLVTAKATPGQPNRFISVYPSTRELLSEPDFEIRSALNLRLLSSRPVLQSRQLLVVIDPSGFTTAELRRCALALAQALTQEDRLWRAGSQVRVGLPVLDGILSDPIAAPSEAPRVLESILSSYISDTFLAEDNSLGRTMEVIAGLVRKAEGDAPLDCLILAVDRNFAEDGSAYLQTGMERRFLEISSVRGSTFYGYLRGHGLVTDLCLSTGGAIASLENPAADILSAITDGRSRGYVLELAATGAFTAAGRFPVSVHTRSLERIVEARAPQAFWNHPDGAPAPEYLAMREALNWLRRADQAEKEMNLTVGMRWIETAMNNDPWNPVLFYRAGRMAAALDDLDLARRTLSRAILFDSCPEEATVLYCEVMRKSGRPAEALEALERMAGRARAESAAIQLERARLLASLGKFQEARSAYNALLQAGKDQAQVRAELGRVLWRLGDEPGARENLTAVLQLEPGNATALVGESEITQKENKLKEALELARRATETDSRYPEAEAQLGMVYAALGNRESAEQHLLQARNLAPARKEFAYALSDYRFQNGRVSESEAILQRLLTDDRADAETRMKLSDALVRSGQLAEAAATLESGAEYNPEQAPDFYLAAAQLRERRTEYGQALLDYRAALSVMNPSHASESLKQHALYLSLALDGARELPNLPVAKELGVAAAFAGLPAPSTPSQAANDSGSRSLIVPGGMEPLARALGISLPEVQGLDALKQIFAVIGTVGANGKENPLSRKAITHLGDLYDLQRHLQSSGVLPPDFDPVRGQDLVFPLLGDEDSRARTAKFLSFFGIDEKRERRTMAEAPRAFDFRSGELMERRRQLLQNLGVEIARTGQKEIRFSLRDQVIPLVMNRNIWSRQLKGGKDQNPRGLLARLLASPQEMKLYNALVSCSESVRGALLKAVKPDDLRDLADTLAVFGGYLDVRDGHLVLPGSQEAWEALLGVPYSEADRFLLELLQHDRGRALPLYAGLSAASEDVQRYFTGSSEPLQRLYESLVSYGSVKSGYSAAAMGIWNLLRTMRQFTVQAGGLQLAGDPRAGPYLLGTTGTGTSAPGAGVNLRDLPRLLDFHVNKQTESFYRGDVLELIQFLHADRPKLMSDQNLSVLIKDPEGTAVSLDLIRDLEPSPELLSEYFEYCRQLAPVGLAGWSANKIRSSQSLFHLISLLRREGAITAAESNTLLADALRELRSAEEWVYAQALANFLSTRLLPILRRSADGTANEDELVLKSLTGSLPVRDFMFEGRRLQLDASALRLQTMKESVLEQRFTPLATLLEIYRLLNNQSKANVGGQELGASITRLLAQVRPAEMPTRSSSALRQRVAGIDLAAAQSEWNERIIPRMDAVGRQLLVQKLAADLSPEIGVTLLTYCYAYYASPAIDTLTFDVNFIRKQDFLGNEASRPVWRPARLLAKEKAGSFVSGSVSGLDYVLASLETSSAAMGVGNDDATLLPTLVVGMRAVRRTLRTDRAQEFAALLTRLGRELLTLAAVDKPLRVWCDKALVQLVPPKRRESVANALARLETGVAARLLYPSELFFLGETYLQSLADRPAGAGSETMKVPAPRIADTRAAGDSAEPAANLGAQIPRISSPILDRLKEVAAAAAQSNDGSFKKEVAQFGVLLRSRLWIGDFSLTPPEPYEYLELQARKEVLFERICDLRMRLADLNYALGLPSLVAELEVGLALRDILPRLEKGNNQGWQQVLDKVNRLGIDNTRGWIDEALRRGWLIPAAESEKGAEADKR
jgi:tetratricopeptide (TPR) repeat protein